MCVPGGIGQRPPREGRAVRLPLVTFTLILHMPISQLDSGPPWAPSAPAPADTWHVRGLECVVTTGFLFSERSGHHSSFKEQNSIIAQNDTVVICNRTTTGTTFYRQLMYHYGNFVWKVCVTRGKEKSQALW